MEEQTCVGFGGGGRGGWRPLTHNYTRGLQVGADASLHVLLLDPRTLQTRDSVLVALRPAVAEGGCLLFASEGSVYCAEICRDSPAGPEAGLAPTPRSASACDMETRSTSCSQPEAAAPSPSPPPHADLEPEPELAQQPEPGPHVPDASAPAAGGHRPQLAVRVVLRASEDGESLELVSEAPPVRPPSSCDGPILSPRLPSAR